MRGRRIRRKNLRQPDIFFPIQKLRFVKVPLNNLPRSAFGEGEGEILNT